MAPLKAISESTNVTIGLSAGVVVAAFWAGVKLGAVETQVAGSRAADAVHDVRIAELDKRSDDHEIRIIALKTARAAAP